MENEESLGITLEITQAHLSTDSWNAIWSGKQFWHIIDKDSGKLLVELGFPGPLKQLPDTDKATFARMVAELYSTDFLRYLLEAARGSD